MRILMKESNEHGNCEVCNKTDIPVTKRYQNIWYCDACWLKEQKAIAEHQSPANQEARVAAYRASNQVSKEIDASIRVRSDLFNASTVSIEQLRNQIESDPTITNKPYTLAQTLMERFEQQRALVFELQEKLQHASNEQKAIQVYLNNMANQLRQEERDRLRLQDINYKPQAPKTVNKEPKVKKIKTTQTSKSSKFDKKELREAAARLGVSEFVLQQMCVSKGLSIKDGAERLKKIMDKMN